MDDLVPVLVVVVSTAGAVLAARIAASAQRSSNKMRASLDAATAQNAAQAALYDGYGDLSGHYRTRRPRHSPAGDRGARTIWRHSRSSALNSATTSTF
jgi:hypothetical protein